MAIVSYKCPNCGGDLGFDPESQKLKCDYCLSTFDKEEIEEAGYSLVTPIVVTNTSAYLDVIADDNRGAITVVK